MSYAGITDEQFTFTFGKMGANMRDVAFYFRKTGIKSTDFGLADIVLGREDLTIFMVSSTGAHLGRKGCARSCRGLYSISSVLPYPIW